MSIKEENLIHVINTHKIIIKISVIRDQQIKLEKNYFRKPYKIFRKASTKYIRRT